MRPAEAYIQAGYKGKKPIRCATQLQRNPIVRAEIERLFEEREKVDWQNWLNERKRLGSH